MLKGNGKEGREQGRVKEEKGENGGQEMVNGEGREKGVRRRFLGFDYFTKRRNNTLFLSST